MKHKEKRVLMRRGDKFHTWPAEAVDRREFQGWEKVPPNSTDAKRYRLVEDEATTTKTTEKGA